MRYCQIIAESLGNEAGKRRAKLWMGCQVFLEFTLVCSRKRSSKDSQFLSSQVIKFHINGFHSSPKELSLTSNRSFSVAIIRRLVLTPNKEIHSQLGPALDSEDPGCSAINYHPKTTLKFSGLKQNLLSLAHSRDSRLVSL